MADTTTKLSMKLLVDKKVNRVVFAEAKKDIVDFLFAVLALPIGMAIELIGKESMVGCVGDLYASVEKLDETYLQPGLDKDAILHHTSLLSPLPSSESTKQSPLHSPAPSRRFFTCKNQECYDEGDEYPNCKHYITDVRGTKCPHCEEGITDSSLYLYVAPGPGCSCQQVQDAETAGGGGGYVQGVVMYTVTDNLTVTPMSAISCIALLSTHGVKDLDALQEKTVQIGENERLEILKASLHSKTVLTDVFLGKKPRGRART